MKDIFQASLMSLLIAVSFSSFADEGNPKPKPVTVNGGKLTFTGSVVAAPCAVDNASDTSTVSLGQVPVNSLATIGSVSSDVDFKLKLSGCDLSANVAEPTSTASYTSASITFEGKSTVNDTTLDLSSTRASGGTAQGVGLQIMQGKTAVKVNGSKATDARPLVADTNEIPFRAVYVATADKVVAGSANATVNFKVNYE